MCDRVPRIGPNPLRGPRSRNGSVQYLKLAKEACANKNYSKAYENFINYFECLRDPSEATASIQSVFTKLVCKMGPMLEETGNIEELLKCYVHAINLFPKNFMILDHLGAYMFKIGEVDIARRYLHMALTVNPDYLRAEKNLLHLKWQEVPRWHFRMLNDYTRNFSYCKAIRLTIAEGYKDVADIGAGCGLLSLLARVVPGSQIVAYEENKAMQKILGNILREYEIKNVHLVKGNSTQVQQVAVSERKCNLLITEIFDVALFGERALESIYHALTVIRTEDDFKIIPGRAKVFVTGINSMELLKKTRLTNPTVVKLLNLKNACIRVKHSDPYKAEHLSEYDTTYLTDTQAVYDIDFSNSDQISNLIKGDESETVLLTCKQGTIHAFAVWFDLYLTDQIQITTNPQDKNCCKCWEQAVFYLDHPLEVKEGQVLMVKATLNNCKLNFRLPEKEEEDEGMHTCLKVSKEIVAFLNDRPLVDTIISVTEAITDKNIPALVDENAFPLLGVILSKKGYCKIVCHQIKTLKDCDKEFFRYIVQMNKASLRFHAINDGPPLMSVCASSMIFCDFIAPDGSLEGVMTRKYHDTKAKITIPHAARIVAKLIRSPYLDYCNRIIVDTNVFQIDFGKYLNEYTGTEHPNLEKLPYDSFSAPIEFSLLLGKHYQCIPVTNTGVINAIYYWYELDYTDNISFSTLDSSYYRKCCFLLNPPRAVSEGEKLKIMLHTDFAYIKFSIE